MHAIGETVGLAEWIFDDTSFPSFSLTLLLGVIGNFLIIVAIIGYRKMKTPTNIFLASLAFADLLLCLICLPVKVSAKYWKTSDQIWQI